ncbi:MAG TPA: hypothetical protein VMF06_11550 [Candidatus Limnocylindria bacterium]|nr:hypothetical protein [Candidatus Limnocylindria bacterium]
MNSPLRRCLRFGSLVLLILALSQCGTAQTLRSFYDAICGLPGVRITDNTDPNQVTIVQSAESLGDESLWSSDLTLGSTEHSHDWYDPAARAERRRFYRYLKVPRTPLAPVPNFRLTDHLGFSHELLREGDAKVVVLAFTDNDSLGALAEQLAPLMDRFAASPIRFWLVNPVDTRESLSVAAQQQGIQKPILHDAAQLVAKAFGATTAGEVIAVSIDDFTEVYRGAVSDLCATPTGSVQQNYLSDALDQFLVGGEPAVKYARSRGKSLALKATGEIVYSRDIAPLLLDKCVRCHRPGDIGSWTMTNHAAIQDKALSIVANVIEGLMPPWHADKAYLPFANDYSITPAQQAMLVEWANSGAPKDNAPDPLVTNPPSAPLDWPLGTPDLTVGFTTNVPSSSQGATIPYKYVFIRNPYPQDVWLKAAVIKPGNRRVVHHSLLFVGNTSELIAILNTGGLGGFFASYVPGLDPVTFPQGSGKRLKKGDYLVFQMHYTPIPQAVTDNTQVGFYFAPAPPAKELKTGAAYTTDFTIPPNARTYPAGATISFPKAATIYEMSPHMHLRGNRMRMEAFYPNGTSEIILNVPKYDFAWQTLYRLATPKQVPANTVVRVTGDFDNSPWNPFNPNPNAEVTFGEQTGDEMFIGYINYTE